MKIIFVLFFTTHLLIAQQWSEGIPDWYLNGIEKNIGTKYGVGSGELKTIAFLNAIVDLEIRFLSSVDGYSKKDSITMSQGSLLQKNVSVDYVHKLNADGKILNKYTDNQFDFYF